MMKMMMTIPFFFRLLQIATVVDRLMFVVYVLITVTAYIVILVIVPANQPPTTTAALGSAGADAVTQFWGG
jgi:hypothetical protein